MRAADRKLLCPHERCRVKPRNFGSQTDLNNACLQDAVREVIKKHGGVRPAARALKMTAAYLSRLSRGAKVWPNDRLLKKFGVRRSVIYWKLGEPQLPEAPDLDWHSGLPVPQPAEPHGDSNE